MPQSNFVPSIVGCGKHRRYFRVVFTAGSEVNGRFVLEARVGTGTFATVWRAYDRLRQESVALKIFPNASLRAASAAQRAETEAGILHTLDHPYIVRSYAWIGGDDYTVLAMRYVPGATLHEELERRASANLPYSPGEAASLVLMLSEAIQYAHGRGIVHRDLKPKNLIVPSPAFPSSFAVLDFGVAKVLNRDPSEGTTIGRRLGTILYMSPEQFFGTEVSPASDIFALATLTYELLTFHHAWARDKSDRPLPVTQKVLVDPINNLETIMARVAGDRRPKVTKFRRDLPRAVDRLLERAWSVDPRQRPTSAAEFASILSRIVATMPKKQPMNSVLAVALSASACILATSFYAEFARALAAKKRAPALLPLQIGVVPSQPRLDGGAYFTRPDAAVSVAAPPPDPAWRSRVALRDAAVFVEAPVVSAPVPGRRAALLREAQRLQADLNAEEFQDLIREVRKELPNLPEHVRPKARRDLEAGWIRQDVRAVRQIIEQLPEN